jgi:O-antigen/teichoic acid export membrane protein
MLVEKTMDAPAASDASHHKMTFFRQSGWMMIATMAGGVFAAAVHVFSKVLPKEEYAAMGTLIQMINWMMIPGMGLQMVFAQQTSAAVTEEQRQKLVSTFKAAMRWTFYIWLVMALVVLVEQNRLVAALKLSNPASLWLAAIAGLLMLWLPIFQGLLQGRQNFLWLGWVQFINGVGRFIIAGAVVVLLHGWAASVIGAFVVGMMAALVAGMWQNADLWKQPGAPFDAKGWLWHIAPLTLGFGVSQFMLSADVLVVQTYLGGEGQAAPYNFGGTMARAIVLFTGPLAAVMFPKLVHSAARKHKGGGNLLGMTLLGTVVLSCIAAVALTYLSPMLIHIGSKKEYESIVPLMPLFAWAMVPLAVGNVLLNNLMAHSRFKASPVLVGVAVVYWIALQHYHESFKMVVQTLGVFNLIFLTVCAVFTWLPNGGKSETD